VKFFLYSPILLRNLNVIYLNCYIPRVGLARTITSSFLSLYRWKKSALESIVVCLIIFPHSIFFLISIVFFFNSCRACGFYLGSVHPALKSTWPFCLFKNQSWDSNVIVFSLSPGRVIHPHQRIFRFRSSHDVKTHSIYAISCAHINCMTSCRINTNTERVFTESEEPKRCAMVK
jgi:hypothetical protein